MTTEMEILRKIHAAVGDSGSIFYTQDELKRFAQFHLDKWDEISSEECLYNVFSNRAEWERHCRRTPISPTF